MKTDLLKLTPEILKTKSLDELKVIAKDIRSFLMEKIPETGGHYGPNLGAVELSVALHYVFESPKDQIIFDIGHQSYPHKIITGRAAGFDRLRQKGGISGFISYQESVHDVWESGHAGTALSAMMGALYARKDQKDAGRVIALVGDGALSSGMSLEALNLIGYHQLPGIIIINNNEMSISKSVGAISKLMNSKNTNKAAFFKDLGYQFYEVEEGHDLEILIKTFAAIKLETRPVLILVKTIKGKGDPKAEKDKVGNYHIISKETFSGVSWSYLISDIIKKLQVEQKTYVVVPAMELGSELKNFKESFPDRFLDVGISEEHAATMAANLARQGNKVVLFLYSTFSQRAFDQILNDIARPNIPVLITVDRAGLIPGDGSTHQGIYDISMFNMMPNMIISSPKDQAEAEALIKFSLKINHPFILRFPKEQVCSTSIFKPSIITDFSWEKLHDGNQLTIISYGPILKRLKELLVANNLDVSLINARFIKPIDKTMLNGLFKKKSPILVIEENVNTGGLYPEILRYQGLNNLDLKITDHNLNNQKIIPATYEELLDEYAFSNEALLEVIKRALR